MASRVITWEQDLYNFVNQSVTGGITTFLPQNIPFNRLQRRVVRRIANHTNNVPQSKNQSNIPNRSRVIHPEQRFTYTDPSGGIPCSRKVVASTLVIGPPGTGKTHVICAGSILREFNPDNLNRLVSMMEGKKTQPFRLFIATFSNAGSYRIFEKFHEIATLAHTPEYYTRIKLVQARSALESYAFGMLRRNIGLNPADFILSNKMPRDGSINQDAWRKYLREMLIFVGTTDSLSELGTDKASNLPVHSVIYDEASQITIPQYFQVIPQLPMRSITVVGDNCQLPPVSTLQPLGVSALTYLQGTVNYQNIPIPVSRRTILEEQYRMHPAIAQLTRNILDIPRTVIPAGNTTDPNYFLPRASFTIANLPTQLNPSTLTMMENILLPEHSVVVVDTSNVPQATDTQVGKSRVNKIEGQLAIGIYNALRQVYSNLNINEIIITAPYEKQVRFFERYGVRTGTVHQYQGQESEAVIYSLTFARPGKKSEFFSKVELMYVGLSRAKKKLIILGNQSALTHPDQAIQAIRNTIFNFQYLPGGTGYRTYNPTPNCNVNVNQQFLSDIINHLI